MSKYGISSSAGMFKRDWSENQLSARFLEEDDEDDDGSIDWEEGADASRSARESIANLRRREDNPSGKREADGEDEELLQEKKRLKFNVGLDESDDEEMAEVEARPKQTNKALQLSDEEDI